MTIQPTHERVDVGAVVWQVLHDPAQEAGVKLWRDDRTTKFTGETGTVYQVPLVEAAGDLPGNRWLFEATVTTISVATSRQEALKEAWRTGDVLLSRSTVNETRLSSVKCVQEPVLISAHEPTGAAQYAATYKLFVRKEKSRG